MSYDQFNPSATEELRATLTLSSKNNISLDVVRFEGHQSTLTPYQIEIIVDYDNSKDDIIDLVGLSAYFTLHYLGETSVHHGIIEDVLFDCTSHKGKHLYVFILKPRFSLLNPNTQYRLFHDHTVPEIIRAVLEANSRLMPPHSYELRLVDKKTTPLNKVLSEPLTYCAQHHESDGDFLLRLMAEWGLGFYFEQDTDAHIERLIITNGHVDHGIAYPGYAKSVPYELDGSGNYHHGVITDYEASMNLGAQSTELRHYRDASPTWPLEYQSGDANLLEYQRISDKNSTSFKPPEPRALSTVKTHYYLNLYADLSQDGCEYLTRIAQASQTASNMTIDGTTNHVGLHACQAMAVDGLDEDRLEHRAWLMTESHFSGHVNHHQLSKRQASMPDYQCRFHAVPNSRTAYRLPQTTSATQTPSAGITNAIVVGNKQGEVSCDNQNRVKVRLLWSGLNLQQQEETTAYLRVTQPWASNGFGAQFIPRVGDEVLVRFLGGSPNCPLIVDSVHNPQHPHPENANHYRNGFVTQTPDRQGKNQLIFDDSNGKEQIEISTTGNKIETINKTHQVTVGGKQSITIGENQETTVHENQHLTIKQDQELKIGGTQLTEVAKAIKLSSEQGGIELHSKKHTIIEAGESISFSAKKKIVLNAGETISLQVGSTHLTIDAAQLTTFPMMSLSKDTLPLTALTTSAIGVTPTSEANAQIDNGAVNRLDNTSTASTEQTASSSTQQQKQKKTLRIGVFFDGTGNNQTNDEYKAQFGDQSPTNVARLFDAYPFVKGESYAIYVSGIGTVDGIPIIPGERNAIIDAGDDLSTFSQATGVFDDNGAFHKWQTLLRDFSGIIRDLSKEGIYETITHVEFDVFGFSRGASLARHFINAALAGLPDYMSSAREQESLSIVPNLLGNERLDKFAQEKQYEMQNNERVTETRDYYVIDKSRQVSIDFVGLFDTVGSFYLAGNNDEGSFKLGLESGCANTIYQICAHHEYRKNFPLTSVGRSGNAFSEGNVYQEVFPGCHSDIGGGYPSKNQYGRQDLPKRLGQPVNSTYYRECVERVSLYEKYNSEMYRISSDYEINLFIDEKLAQENLAWENTCRTQYGAKGEVKYDDGKFYYYRLMPIDNALSGLAFERMKQQGELHGIQWVEARLAYPQDYANDPHIIKPLWENLKSAPLGTIDISLWQASEAQLLSTSIHRSHGATSPGYGSIKEHLANEPTRDRNGNLVREVFANE